MSVEKHDQAANKMYHSPDPPIGQYNKNATVWTSGNDNSMFENFMKETKSEIVVHPNQQFSCSRACRAGIMSRRFSTLYFTDTRYPNTKVVKYVSFLDGSTL